MIEYDIDNLQAFLNELSPKERTKLFKAGFRKAANKVRKVAVRNLRGSGIRSGKELEKGIRRVLYRKKSGFRVTVGSAGKGNSRAGDVQAAHHTNRRGKKKPILVWAEGGTARRFVKGSYHKGKRHRGHSTGKMPAYGYMKKTREEVLPTVEKEIKESIIETIHTKARKYGGK
ncbi:MAG: hypothetical protein K2J49_05650 [Muribaculaceae bacterium]|nr:hypothetical protein [Muribaculaceae bacterium]